MPWLIKRENSPFWYAQWLHPNGSRRRITKSTGVVGKREAKARAQALEDEFRAQWQKEQLGAGATARLVIAQHWESDARLKKAAGTLRGHLVKIEAHIGPDQPYCLVVTTRLVAAAVDTWRQTMSPSTINRHLTTWARMHKLARRKRELPVQDIDWESVRQEEPPGREPLFTPAQIKAVVERLDPEDAAIVAFALATGIRRQQVIDLTWDRVDLARGVVQIWRKHRKAYAPHHVVLTQLAARILLDRKSGGTVGPDGKPSLVFNASGFRKRWDRAVAAEGIDLRFHDLRHLHATWALEEGTPLVVLSKMLGHSSVAVTERYAHVRQSELERHVSRLALPDMTDVEGTPAKRRRRQT